MCICKLFPFVAQLRRLVLVAAMSSLGDWSAESSIKADLLRFKKIVAHWPSQIICDEVSFGIILLKYARFLCVK